MRSIYYLSYTGPGVSAGRVAAPIEAGRRRRGVAEPLAGGRLSGPAGGGVSLFRGEIRAVAVLMIFLRALLIFDGGLC